MGRHSCEISHPGLGKYRKIYGKSYAEVKRRSDIIVAKWDEEYDRLVAKEQYMEQREELRKQIIEKEERAIQLTLQASHENEIAETLFINYLQTRSPFTLHKLKNLKPFENPRPEAPKSPKKPDFSQPKYKPKLGLFDFIFSQKRDQKIEEAEELYRTDFESWQILSKNINDQFVQKVHQWEIEKRNYYDKQKQRNQEIDRLEVEYGKSMPKAIELYFKLSLLDLSIPFISRKSLSATYSTSDRALIVNYLLPDIADLPNIKEYKYIKKVDEFKKIQFTEKYINALYDKFVYNLIMMIYSQLFSSDYTNILNEVIFNGCVNALDKSTGKNHIFCIASSIFKKSNFILLNLNQVDPESCLKNSQWRSQKQLHLYIPVRPFRLK